MQGGQNITYNFAFDAMVTRETGRVELIHLKELDLPQTNLDFGQTKNLLLYLWCLMFLLCLMVR
jgi:hypothetical protein